MTGQRRNERTMHARTRGLVTFVVFLTLAGVLVRIESLRYGRGVLVVAGLLLLIAIAVAWASTGGQRGPRADRDPADFGIASAAGNENDSTNPDR
jgi:4-amino-4-deoxy-L-arabinose transferase-like glycosyltransferase